MSSTIHEGLILLQTYMIVLTVTGLLMGAATSERQQVQRALRDSREELKLTLRAASVGTWWWNQQTGQVRWSRELEEIHGLRCGSFGGGFDDFVQTVHPDDRSKVLSAIERSMQTDESYAVEYRSSHPDGTIHWMEGRGSVLHDALGAAIGMRGTCMDVTSRKYGEKAVMAAEARQLAILDGALDGIITTDAEGSIVQFNAAAERIFGRTRAETIGRLTGKQAAAGLAVLQALQRLLDDV